MQFKNKLAIFDLDGTLFDTKDVNYYSYNEALKKYGIYLDYQYFCNYCNGKKYTQFLPDICNLSENDFEIVHNNKKKLYIKYINKAIPNYHLFNIISTIKPYYNIALVTTASRKNTMELLNYFEKTELFDLILTQDEIQHPKPNPEGFLKAISYFKVPKDRVVIFEDSSVGLEAALQCTKFVYKCYGFNN